MERIDWTEVQGPLYEGFGSTRWNASFLRFRFAHLQRTVNGAYPGTLYRTNEFRP